MVTKFFVISMFYLLSFSSLIMLFNFSSAKHIFGLTKQFSPSVCHFCSESLLFSCLPPSAQKPECPGQNTGVGSLSLLQGIFPTQGLNLDWTQISHIAGRFFNSWATREAQEYWSGFVLNKVLHMHSTFLFFKRKFSTFPGLILIYLLEKTSFSPPPDTAIIQNTLLFMR